MAIEKFSSKTLSGSELKRFRHAVSELKKQGLIKRSIAAGSARPYFLSEGKTLREIVNKHASSLQPLKSAPKKPPLAPLSKPISVREFPHKHKSLAGVFSDLKKNSAEINKLKKPDEKFGFQIDGIRSYAIYSDIEDLIERLEDSGGIQQVLKKRQDSQELFSKLKIVRWNQSAKLWKPGPQKAKKKRSHAGRQVKSRRNKTGKK